MEWERSASVVRSFEAAVAALRYQHRPKNADRAITDGLDALVQAQRTQKGDDDEDGATGKLVPVA
ncbi:hypothetical protein [Thermomonospora cellulosilytica]|uniref:Uncharacterized protein n=1 Tax=Thermomonospora cellulosilytica TaxID=1411118 RepID=A0A7W3MV55_9ACTN|nr:hypothetical protein [Thermomonospora cellulosilytica]MBA9002469.1 hypothetical protein [Thermomonospora cellulosilytica]